MKPEIDNSPIDLPECTLCPRNCRVRRSGGDFGYCRAGMDFNIAAICTHRGEEPVLSGKSGICNIFFTHCNLQCIFCQNHQISRNDISHAEYRRELKQVIEEVEKILESSVTAVGFVSPSHCIRQMTEIIHFLRQRGRKPIFVMNTNAYDKSETLKTLEEEIERLGFQNGWVQEPESAGHYLPDFHRPGIFPE